MKCIHGVLAVVMLAVSLLPGRGEVTAGSPRDLRDGYYLLDEVCDDESQVAMLTIVKTTPPALADYLNRVSKLAQESLSTMDRMADHDASLHDAADPLPPFERATRSSADAGEQHMLLFGSKGVTYQRRLLFTQIEAANYILHLAKVWSERDPDTHRAATMGKLSARWTKIRDEGFRMLDASS